MSRTQIRAETVIAARPAQVWQVLADHENADKWLSFTRVIRRRPGAPDPNGVGAVRALLGGAVPIEERITLFEPERRIEYDVVKGAPGSETHGQILLTPTREGGTLVWWRVTLAPYVPGTGWLIRAVLGRAMGRSLRRLKDRLEPAEPAEPAVARAEPARVAEARPPTRRRA